MLTLLGACANSSGAATELEHGASVQPLTMAEVVSYLQTRPKVDLTHAFGPGIPHWPGFPDSTRERLYGYSQDDPGSMGAGFLAERYCHVGQWGTHVDPPAHFVEGLRTLDQITLDELIAPLVVIDVHEQVAANPDYVVGMDDVNAWEAAHGPIPERAFVALRTDWSLRWPDAAAMRNADAEGLAHYPGWSLEVLTHVLERRHAVGVGHEQTDTDPGLATSRNDYALETFVLSHDRYQIELLTGLDAVPEAGALVVVSFPKPQRGSGFPARVFALLP